MEKCTLYNTDLGIKFDFQKYKLDFKFNAGTSRGVLTSKDTWIIKIWNTESPGIFGLGEAGPLKGLSIDDRPDFEDQLSFIKNQIEGKSLPNEEEVSDFAKSLVVPEFPSIQFAVETALLDLHNGGERIIFDNAFSRGESEIPINGLIWMGDKEFMLNQIDSKMKEGYSCLKMKIGAIDFKQELEVLTYIRQHFKGSELTLRADANGAFAPDEALGKLSILSEFDLHSIEQPIKPGQIEVMSALCRATPIPIALDEELIGVTDNDERKALLEEVQPQYIILKPTLLGGIKSSKEWIEIANDLGIGWWFTSALESNIGLNAISQFTAQFKPSSAQGLGTGQLYNNNFKSPLHIKSGRLHYAPDNPWSFSGLHKLI